MPKKPPLHTYTLALAGFVKTLSQLSGLPFANAHAHRSYATCNTGTQENSTLILLKTYALFLFRDNFHLTYVQFSLVLVLVVAIVNLCTHFVYIYQKYNSNGYSVQFLNAAYPLTRELIASVV